MGTRVVGKLEDWEDGDVGSGEFMDLTEGSNLIRVITSPYQFYSHYTMDVAKANRKVKCSIDNCPVCQRGERAGPRWYIGVLNKKGRDTKAMILEIGPQIYKQIVQLKKKDSWGDPRRYDLDIIRGPKGASPLYTVSPEPHAPLTDEDKALIVKFKESVDLGTFTSPPTPEEICEKLGLPIAKKPEVSDDFGGDSSSDGDDNDFFSDLD